ncbi:UDP-4-amino-4-deoxy-L-arabinose-oxoglutarateaminotransferase UDP-(beta-L-threo-pentapyranosyl-4''-ulose diphosphate) aminotransferase; UDP-Ara4O aminotransferase [Salmonella enterica subsp. enterica serovar Daytona]|uniref:UDP-4-amino-4-deoxy-L-arabinose-oxoglutarateaminotransferase UDP-(Beta-L-threo-pentapyranosyl-4''-ulose diphosphate) aminotransferase UDP-Ara4O aminotransferase n=1 Tax=Salmonella enterica subsp. enterica serovar Daytona TaxID=1962639 RepID=A0A447JR09_SALET|nr:UDP-4-amino-4-deoxy-L-arabinose-oxoglutarateaminotransferase UDP-(beta-L-threo-pentapyranosyl-4''-ulose diphosphate) aminotransferase; UDP-Ara4O aminotransferase [Salmonella enterica subsp. enterica serovar Daytona]
MAVFHYIPLHDCPAGDKFGEFIGDDVYTTKESERLLRLPLFYNLAPVDQRSGDYYLAKLFLLICRLLKPPCGRRSVRW